MVLDGGGSTRLLKFTSGADATLIGLTLTNGAACQGAAVYVNGGVVSFERCNIISNHASSCSVGTPSGTPSPSPDGNGSNSSRRLLSSALASPRPRGTSR